MKTVAVFLLDIGGFLLVREYCSLYSGEELVMETPVVAEASVTDAEVEKRLKNYRPNALVIKRSAHSPS